MASCCRRGLASTLAVLLLRGCVAKVVDGAVQLSSLNTEQYLTKFSFSPQAQVRVNGSFHTDERDYLDNHPHALTLCLFDDKAWPKFTDALKKGSLSKERQLMSTWRTKVTPQTDQHAPGTQPRHEFTFDEYPAFPKWRAHYWFAVVMDCYLEEYDAHPPLMHFRLSFFNGGSQLPADEDAMPTINLAALVLMLGYGVFYAWAVRTQWLELKQGHLITLVFAAAYALQLASIACELSHLRVYAADGKGLRWRHTWLALDFASGLLQSVSELVISVLLIALAFGWTLGLESQEPIDGWAGRVIAGLQKPSQLLHGARSPASLLLLGVALAQLVLQGLGRRYEEDFNNFHDHEHWPGRCLVAIRLGMCGLFVWALSRSARVERQSEVLSFLRKLGLFGTAWFLCLPLLVLLAMAAPPYRRHQLVAGGSVMLQAVALALLSTLFLRQSEFYRISSLAHLGSVFDLQYARASTKLAVD